MIRTEQRIYVRKTEYSLPKQLNQQKQSEIVGQVLGPAPARTLQKINSTGGRILLESMDFDAFQNSVEMACSISGGKETGS